MIMKWQYYKSNLIRLGTIIFMTGARMEGEIIQIILRVKEIIVYLILILFLIDLARADNYKIARIIKILLFPLLIIFNIHYKKINIGLLLPCNKWHNFLLNYSF